MNKYIEEVVEQEKLLTIELGKEQEASFLGLVKRPDGAKEALEFQYEGLDTLSSKTLEKYLGALSQYLIFVTKYVNILSARKKIANSVFNRKLNAGYYLHSQEIKNLKSITEKEIYVKQADPDLIELEDYLGNMDAKMAIYSNIPDTINGLIQSIKKIYDARIRETLIQNNN